MSVSPSLDPPDTVRNTTPPRVTPVLTDSKMTQPQCKKFCGTEPTFSWSIPCVGTLSNMYMTSEEGVSLSCANSVTLDISLASPGSTSSPLFLKDKRWTQGSLFSSTPGRVMICHEVSVGPDDTRLLVVHRHHFDRHLSVDVVPAVSQLDGKTVLRVLRVIMHVHQIHTWVCGFRRSGFIHIFGFTFWIPMSFRQVGHIYQKALPLINNLKLKNVWPPTRKSTMNSPS